MQTSTRAAIFSPILRGRRFIRQLRPAAWYQRGVGTAGQWDDTSGNGAHFLQTEATNQLALTAYGTRLADGVNKYMSATLNLPQPYTIYGLVNTVTHTNLARLLNGDDAGLDSRIFQSAPSPQIIFSAPNFTNPISPVLNTANVITVVGNGASSLIQLNNDSPVTGNVGTRAFNNPTLGADNLPGSYANTDNYEWIFFGAAHDAATRDRAIAYLLEVKAR